MVEIGLQIEPQFGFSYDDIRNLALLCESSGFNSLWCSDHFFLNDNSAEQDCLDCWTILAGLTRETSTLRLGSLVTAVSYRYPAVLAKIAASVDNMSNGRLDFGVGAGWKQLEYQAYGIRYPSVGERVSRFQEALDIILRLWTEPKASYQGKYYHINDAYASPKPVQKPHAPIWIGGSGNRMLDIASRYANGINISGFPPLERYKERLEVFRAACQRNNADYDSIKKSHFTGIAIAPNSSDLDALVNDIAQARGESVDSLRANFRGFIGTPEEVTGFLKEFVDLGVQQFMLVFPYGHEAESVKLIADQVLPNL